MAERIEISKGLVLLNSVSSLVLRVLSLTVLLWMHQHLLSRLSDDEYAVYPVIVSVMVVAPLLISVLAGGVGRYLLEAYSRGDAGRGVQVLSSVGPLIFGATVMFFIGGLVFSWHVDKVLTIAPEQVADARLMSALFVTGQALSLLMFPFSFGIQIRQRYILRDFYLLLGEVFRIGLLLALLLVVDTRVLWVVLATVCGKLLSSVLVCYKSLQLVPSLRYRFHMFDRSLVRELTSFGVWAALGNLSNLIRTSADSVILNKLATPTDVTTLHVCTIPDRQIVLATGGASEVLQPALAAMHAKGKRDSLQRAFMRGNRYYLWLTMGLVFPLMAFGRELLDLYVPGRFPSSVAIVLILLYSTYPFRYACELTIRIAYAVGRIRTLLLANLGIQLLRVAVIVLLVGFLGMGAVGVALGTVLVVVPTHAFVLWPIGLRLVELPFHLFFKKVLCPGVLPSVVALVVCLGLKSISIPESWPRMLVYLVLGTVSYVGGVLLCLQSRDRADLSLLLGKVMFWRAS